MAENENRNSTRMDASEAGQRGAEDQSTALKPNPPKPNSAVASIAKTGDKAPDCYGEEGAAG